MVTYIEISLRAWHPDGNTISGEELVAALAADTSAYAVIGSGQKWETARIVASGHSLEAYKDKDEPHEAFFKSVRESLVAFSKWLSSLSPDSLDMLRSKGMKLDLFMDFRIDQDQLELEVPCELISEMG